MPTSNIASLPMAKSRKIHKLDITQDYSFGLIGISCHENDYKLSWAINAKLKLNLSRIANLVITDPKTAVASEFSRYSGENELFACAFCLLSNRSEHDFLVPELKKIDYFLKLSGEYTPADLQSLADKLKETTSVLAIFLLQADKLKSRDRLVF